MLNGPVPGSALFTVPGMFPHVATAIATGFVRPRHASGLNWTGPAEPAARCPGTSSSC